MAELIPQPNIQATNIPTGGGAQVSFDFAAPSNTFANLSKTIAGAAQTMVNFNQLEENERKSKEAWQEQLGQIHGLTKTGQLSEADYMKIQREANGKAQREGIIRAHENWSTIREVDKERSNIRIKALESYLKNSGAVDRMSNPNENIASSWGDEHSLMLEELSSEPLGTDSQGNEVRLDLNNMSPMEMVAFAQGQSALETASKLAIEENKATRAVEASTARLQAKTLTFAEDMDAYIGAFSDDPQVAALHDAQQKLIIEQFQDEINIAYSAGVKNINTHIFEGLSTFTENSGMEADVRDPQGLMRANALIDMVEDKLMLREGHLFAEDGTENYNKLEEYRSSMNKTYQTRVKAYQDAEPDRDEVFLLDIQAFQNNRVMSAEGRATMDSAEEQRQIMRAWRQEAATRGVDFEKHRSSFTTFFEEQVDPIVDEDSLTNLFYRMTTNVMTNETAGELAAELFRLRNNGTVSVTEYKSYLEDITKRRNEALEDDNVAVTEAWESLQTDYTEHIGNYGADRINDDARQMLARLENESSWSMSTKVIPSGTTVANVSYTRRQVLGIMNGGSIEGVNDLEGLTENQLNRIKNDLGSDPRLNDALAMMAAGLKFEGALTKDNIHERHDKSYEYMQARLYLETYFQHKKVQAQYNMAAAANGDLNWEDNTQ